MKGTVSCMSLAKWRAGKRRASVQGWPRNALSMEISSPDKAGTLVSHSLTSASTVLAGCGFSLTCNSPGTKNKLDLESVPLLQMGIIDDYLVRTGPKLGLESGGALAFLIPASGDDYLYLSHCYLCIKCRDIKAYGSHLDTLKADVPRVQTCCSTPSSDKRNWLWTKPWWPRVETHTARGVPDDAAQLRTWCQRDQVKAPRRPAHGRRGKVWCSGKRQPDDSPGNDRQQPALWLQGQAALGHAVARVTGAQQHECLVGAVT